MAVELYQVLDWNEIDGSARDVQITTHGSDHDDDATWTTILEHTQNVPTGNYGFFFDWMIEVQTGEEYFFEVMPPPGTEGVELPVTEIKTERQSGRYYFTYGFPLSWDGGDFTFRLRFKAKDTAGTNNAYVRYADFSLTRRS